MRDENIELCDKIIKINKFGFKQEHKIIITDKALYNIKKISWKRWKDLKATKGITLSKASNEFITHCNDEDYDYQYIS